MEKFVDIFSKKYNLNSKDAASLLALMEPVTYRRGEMLVREGELNTSFHLIGQGIWRGYYLRNGVDVSIWFATTGESLFSTRGYMGGRPSGTSIEAMSDSLLYRIGKQELEAFFHSSAAAANLGRRMFEREFLVFEERLINEGATQAKERYLSLLERMPELLQHVPLKHIASYLYITPPVAEPHPCRTGPKGRRRTYSPTRIIACTSTTPSYSAAKPSDEGPSIFTFNSAETGV